MRQTLHGLLLLVSSLVAGCATQFVGSAHYPGGAAACFTACAHNRMRMSGFVYLGAYSSACVCEPVRASAMTAPLESRSASTGAAGAGGVVGVVLQARAAQAQQYH